ncbi:MAG: hypothetical protein WC510_02060 [Candidatus Omnitrophota bacterium]
MHKIITLKQACELIGISYDYGSRIYHTWPDYGVRILKHSPNARPRFYEEDIYKMMEKRK